MRDNSNCLETHASLRIAGRAVDPHEITQTLGIKPDFQASIGERKPPRSSPRREGLWLIDSENRLASTDLERHVEALLELLPADFHTLLPTGTRCDVHCVWWSATDHGGPELSPTLLARLGSLGLTLGFDVYFENGEIDVFVDDALLPPAGGLATLPAGNPNCARTHASLRISCGDADPEIITRLLGIQPHFQVRSGQSDAPATKPRRQGLWRVSSETMLQSTDLEDHLVTLLHLLPVDFRQNLPEGCDCDVFCYWSSANGHGGPEFSPQTLTLFGRHSIALGFDFYSEAEMAVAANGKASTMEK